MRRAQEIFNRVHIVCSHKKSNLMCAADVKSRCYFQEKTMSGQSVKATLTVLEIGLNICCQSSKQLLPCLVALLSLIWSLVITPLRFSFQCRRLTYCHLSSQDGIYQCCLRSCDRLTCYLPYYYKNKLSLKAWSRIVNLKSHALARAM